MKNTNVGDHINHKIANTKLLAYPSIISYANCTDGVVYSISNCNAAKTDTTAFIRNCGVHCAIHCDIRHCNFDGGFSVNFFVVLLTKNKVKYLTTNFDVLFVFIHDLV
jgi:hypothetical protein